MERIFAVHICIVRYLYSSVSRIKVLKVKVKRLLRFSLIMTYSKIERSNLSLNVTNERGMRNVGLGGVMSREKSPVSSDR